VAEKKHKIVKRKHSCQFKSWAGYQLGESIVLEEELDKAHFIIENGKANLATTNWICQQAIEVHKQVWN
jgi:hypothetical protein